MWSISKRKYKGDQTSGKCITNVKIQRNKTTLHELCCLSPLCSGTFRHFIIVLGVLWSTPLPYLAQTRESKRVSGRPLLPLLILWVLVLFTNSASKALTSRFCSLPISFSSPSSSFSLSHSFLPHQSHQRNSGERERFRGMMTLSTHFFML